MNNLESSSKDLMLRIYKICERNIKYNPLTCILIAIKEHDIIIYIRKNQNEKFRFRKKISTNFSKELRDFFENNFHIPDEYDVPFISEFSTDAKLYLIDISNYKNLTN